MTPKMKPYIHFPLSVCADVTGSVAMNTAPKAKPPMIKWVIGVIAAYGLVAGNV